MTLETKTKVEYFNVEDISCSSCVATLNSLVKEEIGEALVDIKVDIFGKQACIYYKGDKNTLLEKLKGVTAFPLTPKSKKIENIKKTSSPTNHLLFTTIFNLIFGLPLFIFSLLGIIPSTLTVLGFVLGMIVAIATVISMVNSKDIYLSAIKSLAKFNFNMNTLLALGTFSAFVLSLLTIFLPATFMMLHVHFAVVFMVLGINSFGRLLQAKAKAKVDEKKANGLNFLDKLKQQKAHIGENDYDYNFIEKNDELTVKPGEYFLADGKLKSGNALVNASMITGESNILAKTAGDFIYSGSKNETDKNVTIETTQSGRDSIVHKLIETSSFAADGNKNFTFIDRITKVFVPTIIALSFAVAITWYFIAPTTPLAYAISAFLSILLCACPCSLGLAAPISLSTASNQAIAHNILFKDGDAILAGSDIDVLVFDKTGTITCGQATVTDFKIYVEKYSKDSILQFAYLLEKDSSHPYARAICDYAKDYNKEAKIEDFMQSSQGIAATINNKKIIIGNYEFLQTQGVNKFSSSKDWQDLSSPVYFAIDNTLVACFAIGDSIRQPLATKKVIQKLQQNYEIYMLTGDNADTAKYVAEQIGITEKNICAGALPVASGKHINEENINTAPNKLDFIKNLQAKGKKVAMIGDGVNDSAAMGQANLSIAINAWAASSKEAQVCLRDDISALEQTFAIAKKTNTNIKQNLSFSLIYNCLSIVLAAGVLMPIIGTMSNPILASISMALSSVIVVLNALRLYYQINYDTEQSFMLRIKSTFLRAPSYIKTLTVGFALSLAATIAGIIACINMNMSIATMLSVSSILSGGMGCFGCIMFSSGVVMMAMVLLVSLFYGAKEYLNSIDHKDEIAADGQIALRRVKDDGAGGGPAILNTEQTHRDKPGSRKSARMSLRA